MEANKIYNIDSLEGAKQLPDNYINCIVTSPPYWGLRDYDDPGQLGLEATPEEYVDNLLELFNELKRALRPDGTLWLNLGDSYINHSQPGGGDPTIKNRNIGKSKYKPTKVKGLKPKNLIGIPWRVAFALQTDGWYLRQDIIEEVEFYCPCGCGYIMEERIWRWSQDRELIWNKPNPMPESVTDRCTKSHEYIFLLSKSKNYYFDSESIKEPTITKDNIKRDRDSTKLNNTPGRSRMGGLISNNYVKKNKRSVWTVNSQPFKDAHFAVFPEKLIEPCILAGCPKGGIVLDPFSGAGTTLKVAKKFSRKGIGFELNPEYIKISNLRIAQEVLNL